MIWAAASMIGSIVIACIHVKKRGALPGAMACGVHDQR